MKNFVYVIKRKQTKIDENKINNKLKYITNRLLKDNNVTVVLEDISNKSKEKIIEQKINFIKNVDEYNDSNFMPPYYVLVDKDLSLEGLYRCVKDIDDEIDIDQIDFLDVYSYRC